MHGDIVLTGDFKNGQTAQLSKQLKQGTQPEHTYTYSMYWMLRESSQHALFLLVILLWHDQHGYPNHPISCFEFVLLR